MNEGEAPPDSPAADACGSTPIRIRVPSQRDAQLSDPAGNRVVWFGADGELRYAQAYPEGVAQRGSGRRRVWLRVGLVLLLLLSAVPIYLAAGGVSAILAERVGAADPASGAAPSPGPDSPAGVRRAWVTAQIGQALDQQASALLRGDQKAFLSTVDPQARALNSTLRRRFNSLRELQVVGYTQRVTNVPSEQGPSAGRPSWQARVEIRFCFVVPGCPADVIRVDTGWAETAAGLRMTSLTQTDAAGSGPRPWEDSALRAKVGPRTVVATTERYADQLPALSVEAEKAATVADRFVIDGRRPDRYRIFVAGPQEWKRWYGGDLPKWSVGFATAVSDDRMEVVLNINEIEDNYLDEVLRHEMGHVATLSSDDFADDGLFWLVEGMAEYIQESGQPVNRYDGQAAVRRFLESGRWTGDVNVPAPGPDAPDWQVAAQYGIGYYTVRRMAERFGPARMTRFFSELVLSRGSTVHTASLAAYGVAWEDVNADCARYVRQQV